MFNIFRKWVNGQTEGATQHIDEREFLRLEIMQWKNSPMRRMMINGERYYNGDHDILSRTRTMIGRGGELEEVSNLPNNRIINNQYQKLVDQKANYLLSKPITFECENAAYADLLNDLFNKNFQRRIKNGGIDTICGGVSWIYPYYDEQGNFKFQRFKPYEILPFWCDNDHEELDSAVRLYQVQGWEGIHPVIIEKVEVFKRDGIERYILDGGQLKPDVEAPYGVYAKIGDQGYNWNKVPLIAFKSNATEIPLIKKIKGLQDALNLMLSDYMNNMQEDSRNTILVIKNYDGADLSEFRRNLSTFGAVKVRTVDGADGAVEALQVNVNKDNYESILNELKKAIIENAMGYDAKDDRLGGNANQINIRSMYSDIDIDADSMESEYQAAFEQLLFFVNSYFLTTGKGDFFKEKVKVTFNRDILINESEVIESLTKLGVQLPNEILVGQVPFVDDPKRVIELIKEEQAAQLNDAYAQAFNNQVDENGKE